jgi:hypothetical protein
MKKHLTASILSLLLAAPALAVNGNIVMTFDAESTTYCSTVPFGACTRMWVYGLLVGASSSGITGAEYKIQIGPNDNPDPSWLFQETFAPGALVIGTGAMTPADNGRRGVNVAWPSCVQGDGVKVLIETVEVFSLDFSQSERRLRVVKHDQPANAFFQCPLFVLCDVPVYTKVCLGSNLAMCRNPEPPFANNATCSTSGEAWLNPQPFRFCPSGFSPCTIAVAPRAWSQVKALYRD